MADDTTASVIPLHQVPLKKKVKTGAGRAKAYRPRKRPTPKAAITAEAEPLSSESSIPPEFLSADYAIAEPSVTQPPAVTSHPDEAVAPSRRHLAPALLSIAALALAVVGITINGWFARSLGSSDMAGWLFLAVGVAADQVAFVLPSAPPVCSAGHRATRWLAAVGNDIRLRGNGEHRFRIQQLSDVTLARGSRVTPAVTNAQAALMDAMAARDRECKGGVGSSAANAKRRSLNVARSSSQRDSCRASGRPSNRRG